MILSDFSATAIDGSPTELAQYAGSVVLVVNTASACGFTPQLAGLEELWRTYRDRGLVVLGFPCNQFGGQDPGSEAQISEFCSLTYDVTFPMFAKVEVNGADAHPLFGWLRSEARGALGTSRIKWNFTKFLVGRDGTVRGRYGSTTTPSAIAPDIEAALAE